MATFTQHNEHNIDWSCLPCIGNNSQSDDRRPYHHQRTKIGIDNDDEMKQTEKLLASELSKLSVQERAEAFDDVHCVGEELKETPELIERSLAEFEQVVQRERSHVYHMAWNQNSAYVEDPSFRLKFLRANMHDVDSSVRQMMHFLQLKATYFGNDKVAREITLDDLDKEDMEVLLSGLWHIQEERDRTGRVIVHMFGNLFGKWKAENTIRALHFISMNVLLPDPMVEKHGGVSVYHNVTRSGEKPAFSGINFLLMVKDAAMSFPIRYSAAHYYLMTNEGNLVLHNAILKPMVNSLPQYIRVRSRIHVGSSVELRYQLPSHGIPLDTFPIDIDGKVRESILNLWFYKYQQMQTESKGFVNNSSSVTDTSEISKHSSSWGEQGGVPLYARQSLHDQSYLSIPSSVAYKPFVNPQSIGPTKSDILLGRGRFAQSWDGNVMFRDYIEGQSDAYDSLSRAERQRKTIEVTHELISKGIRFFEQQESGEWIEADFSDARKKVSQMFRSIRKKK